MVEFSLTEEQKAFQTLVREFAKREIEPIAAELEKYTDPARIDEWYPWHIYDKLAQVGLKTMTLKKKWGGAGVDWLTVVVCIEELCAADAGIGGAIQQGCWKYPKVLQELWTDEQCEKFLRPLIEQPRYIMGTGLTEPEAGGDNYLPYLDPKGGARLSAVRDGDHVVLNGMKHFITNGGTASLYLVFARTDKTKPISEGLTLFAVTTDTPGFKIGRFHDKFGARNMTNAELIFENVRLPIPEHQVGGWNTGMRDLPRLLAASNSTTATFSLGVARRIYEKTLEYARGRVQGGVPIIQHQPTQMMLADMHVAIEVSRNIIWKAAWMGQKFADTQDPQYWDPILFKTPKLFTSEAAQKVALLAMEIHGGYAAMKDVGLEKLVRDALTFMHPDGTNTVLRLAIGHML